jgi:N-methylhydantoinase A
LRVAVSDPHLSKDTLARLFSEAYWQRFHVALPEMRPVVVNVHTAVIGVRKGWNLAALASKIPTAQLADAQIGMREVFFGGALRQTPVYAKEKLPMEQEIAGPAIIEQMDCTIVIEPGWRARVDAMGNVCAHFKVAP